MRGIKVLIFCCFAALSTAGLAQRDFSQVEITTHRLADNLYYLKGAGGNIGMLVGEDGVFLIDDQFAPLTEKILAAISAVTDQPVRFVFNTHHHGDHTGGNQNLGKAGAVIVAHENVRVLLIKGIEGLLEEWAHQRRSPRGDIDQLLTADQRAGLPVLTYKDSVHFHLNGENIHAFYNGPGHTSGDSFVHFQNANVIHTGDVFRTTGYPFVDGKASGSFLGILASYEMLLEISNPDTVFLPGHGVPSGQDDIREQLEMLYTIRDRVKTGINDGLNLERIQSTNPTAEYDDRWAGGKVKGPDLVKVVYNELIYK
ncbi:MAG: MBL fold metallo-hydrolase [Woeseiaceae bacterium]|nr:MBL fold metallo-hydrolase [Woeseiaceae bacterium]